MNNFEIIGVIVLVVIYFCFSMLMAGRTWFAFDHEADKRNPSLREAIKSTFYPYQEYFRLWDLIRTPFMIPGFIIGAVAYFIFQAAQTLLPKLFGLKLFRLKKEE